MPKKILVVDDEAHIVRLLQVNLERAGYTIVTARDGVEALQKVADEKPDLITLDILMSPMDGWEVIKRLKTNVDTRHIPIIVISCLSKDEDVFRGWESGVDVYLTKPMNPIEVLSYVKRVFLSLEGDRLY